MLLDDGLKLHLVKLGSGFVRRERWIGTTSFLMRMYADGASTCTVYPGECGVHLQDAVLGESLEGQGMRSEGSVRSACNGHQNKLRAGVHLQTSTSTGLRYGAWGGELHMPQVARGEMDKLDLEDGIQYCPILAARSGGVVRSI